MINVARRVVIIAVAAAVFGVRLSPRNCTGVVVALVGVVAFCVSKRGGVGWGGVGAPRIPRVEQQADADPLTSIKLM